MAATKAGKAGKGPKAHLLMPQVKPAERHPNFTALLSKRCYRSARLLYQDAFKRMAVRDPGFIHDFQATEFDARQYEIFISELLVEAGATFSISGDQPDFEVSIGGLPFTLECVTVNPTKPSGPVTLRAYRATNPADADLDRLRVRAMNDVPTRFGGSLFTKCSDRFGPKKLAYWELPHTVGKPFVLSIQSFHEDGSLAYSPFPLATYLYGTLHRPAWDDKGNLLVEQSAAKDHIRSNGKPIASGFFNNPANAHVAAVLWSNTGTVPKFARMALQGPYADDAVRAFRVGTAADPDPNAHAPQAFLYEVADPECVETWGEGCVLFHNPNAAHPLPHDLIKTVSNAFLDEEGRYVELVPAGMQPFNSLTLFGATEAEHASAAAKAELYYRTFDGVQQMNRETRGSIWWAGVEAAELEKVYRADGEAAGG